MSACDVDWFMLSASWFDLVKLIVFVIGGTISLFANHMLFIHFNTLHLSLSVKNTFQG